MNKNIKYAMLLFLVCITKLLVAQPRVGLKIGMGYSTPSVNYNGTPFVTLDATNGLNSGVVVRFPLNKKWNLQSGIDAAQKGASQKNNNTSFNEVWYYLELPVNIIYTAGKNNTVLLGTGISAGYLLGTSNRLADIDIGINVLGGYQFPIGFSINLAYTHGLKNCANGRFQIESIKNRYAAFTIGYMF